MDGGFQWNTCERVIIYWNISPWDQKLCHKSHSFFPQKEICHVTSHVRLTTVTRQMFIDVTAPKRRLNKTHETIWHEFFNFMLIFVLWSNYLTAFRVIVFQSDQLCIEEQNGKTTFTHGAGEKKHRLQLPGFRLVWLMGNRVLTNMCMLCKAWLTYKDYIHD